MLKTENSSKTSRIFLRKQFNGILSTISDEVSGFPFGSVTPFMLDWEGRPIIFISRIAQHTKNILKNDKVCLTVMDESNANRLEGARVTYIGHARKVSPERLGLIEAKYIRFFPNAASYRSAHDFDLYQIDPVRIRYIEGFAKIFWVESQDFLLEESALPQAELRIIEHMNKDHADTILLYCQHFYQLKREQAQIFSVDPDGFFVRTEIENLYFPFDHQCNTVDEVKAEMIRMAKEARLTT